MLLSDLSIKRPVLAMVISLLLVAFGLLSFAKLPLRELPDIDPPVVSVETVYTGASAAVVESRITQILEDRIAGIEGIETISSVSSDGRSEIIVEFALGRDIEAAANDMRDAVSRVADNLPDEAEPPEIFKVSADENVIVWFNLSSSELDRLALTDYAERYIVDRLSVLDGVARVRIGGSRRYAMRIWLDRVALAARELTVADVEAALRAENVELPAGRVESRQRDLTVRVERSYATPQDFAQLVLDRGGDGHLIRLGEVARVEIGPEEWRSSYRGNGEEMVGIGIIKQSQANTLAVARAARAELERIRPTLPPGTQLFDSFDSSVFIEEAVQEVYVTLAISMGLVVAVIYLFLGTFRAALVPAVTVPICLVASFSVLYALGLSINLLTLLALVLSIGLVVDDAIVVLENIKRRIDLGEPPLLAAYRGAREVGFAVVATTAVLVAVFVPIAFLEGATGRLFSELAFTVAAAVTFSALVALSLSAMMCSKLLRPFDPEKGLNRWTRPAFEALYRRYDRALDASLRHPRAIGAGLLAVVLATVLLFRVVPSELDPPEDRGVITVNLRAPEGSGFEYTDRHMRQLEAAILPLADSGEMTRALTRVPAGFGAGGAMNGGFGILVLEHWDRRERSAREILDGLQTRFAQIPGVRVFPSLPGGMGRRGSARPVQLVIGGSSYEEIGAWQDAVLARAAEIPGLVGLDGDYQRTKPQLRVEIDRNRAADLGVPVQAIGRTLETVFGSRRVTTYVDRGEEYDVILQGVPEQRAQPDDLTQLYVRSERTGELIPLANLIRMRETAEPPSLNRHNRLRAATIEAGLAPGTTLGQALDALERVARETLPAHARLDYKGQSREFRESAAALYFTFGLALLIVFLVLAAQFESFVHPFVIMLTVPLAVAGALLGLALTGGTLNLYSQIGITILIGLAAKNGILIVEFANQLRDRGLAFEAALREASLIRLRPILMTGISTAVGAVPLVFASGAGSASRFAIGVVIVFGVLCATFFTLFVVPSFYLVLARATRSPGAVARELEDYEGAHPGRAPAVSAG